MAGTSPKIMAAAWIEQGHVIEAADVARQAQFQRPAQTLFAVPFALGRLVDEHGADPLHVRSWRPAYR